MVALSCPGLVVPSGGRFLFRWLGAGRSGSLDYSTASQSFWGLNPGLGLQYHYVETKEWLCETKAFSKKSGQTKVGRDATLGVPEDVTSVLCGLRVGHGQKRAPGTPSPFREDIVI